MPTKTNARKKRKSGTQKKGPLRPPCKTIYRKMRPPARTGDANTFATANLSKTGQPDAELKIPAQTEVTWSFLSDSDAEFWEELRSILLRYIQEARQAGSPLIPVLTRYKEAGWEVLDRSSAFDIPKILKAKKRAANVVINSISRIVPVTRHAQDGCDASFLLGAEIVTLGFVAAGEVTPSPQSTWNVAGGSHEAVISAFLDAPALLMQEARDAARAANCIRWRDAKSDRERVIKQVRSLVPITKSVFATGDGEEVRRIALVKPQQRTKLVKRDPDTLSRDDVIDRFWMEAYEERLPRPQRVKI